jgi:hypothetical protein
MAGLVAVMADAPPARAARVAAAMRKVRVM